MSVYAGPADWWTDGTDAGRTHIATKGIVQSGLLLNLDAGVSSSYPGSGTTWTNLASSSYNATITSGSFSSDKGGAITFGSGSTAIGSNALDFSGGGFTISVWLRHTGIVSTARVQRYFTMYSSTEGPVLRHGVGSAYQLQAYVYDSGNTLRNSLIPNMVFTGNYYNFAYTYDGTTFAVYRNGSSVLTNNLTITLPTPTNGYEIGSSVEFFEGDMYIVNYYNRALSAEEIQKNFNALRGRFGV